jgi:hypothetical protein
MKHLILASIFCVTFAVTLPAQAPTKVVPQIIPLPPNIGVWSVVQGIQNSHKHELLVPRELKGRVPNLMKFDASQSTVCSVPLLEVNANANDPGIAVTPRDNSVPFPHARVPAPPCKKE